MGKTDKPERKDKSNRITLSTRMEPAMLKSLKLLAIEEGTTVADLIEEACTDLLRKREKRPRK